MARPLVGAIVAAGSIALTTLLLYPLKEIAPVGWRSVSSTSSPSCSSPRFWGVHAGTGSPPFVSAAAFNFFHIPPTGRFTIADEENWVALTVFFIAAIFVAEKLGRARTAAGGGS